jgi:hypothetical protein
VSGNGHPHGHEELRHESSPWAARIRAVEELLVEKGVFTHEEVRAQIEFTEARTYENGARLVAKAWTDPEFKASCSPIQRERRWRLGWTPRVRSRYP